MLLYVGDVFVTVNSIALIVCVILPTVVIVSVMSPVSVLSIVSSDAPTIEVVIAPPSIECSTVAVPLTTLVV